MNVTRVLSQALSVCLVLCLFSSVAPAQSVTGTITGVIRDPDGAVIPGAKVVARNAGTNDEFATTTDGAGFYRFANLVSGSYVVSVEAQGFRRLVTLPQRLSTGEVIRLDLEMELGQLSEIVLVEEAATRVNTEDSQMGQVLRDVHLLPIISGPGGRNPLKLALTQPGVMEPVTNRNVAVGVFSFNGQRTQANNFLLDGGDSNDLSVNMPDSVHAISPNALAEFSVVTGSMKAEFGRNSGAQVLVTTRSGSNAWHGAASEIFRNTRLNATPFFQNAIPGGTKTTLPGTGFPRRPQWNTNDFDAQFHGPIKRDTAFFFLHYLGFRRRQGVSRSAQVIPDNLRAIINEYGTPEAKNLLALVPRANYGPTTLLTAPANSLRRDQGLVKYDHHLSDKNRFAFTYFVEDQTSVEPFAFGGSSVPGFGSEGISRYTNAVLRDTHTFSATLFNEFRVSFHRLAAQGLVPLNKTSLKSLGLTGINVDNPAAEGPPYVDLSAAGYSGWGNSYQGPQSRFNNTWHFLDNVSWNKGSHYFKFGGEARTFAQNMLFSFLNNGYIYFDGAGFQNGFVDPIPGLNPVLTDFARGYTSSFSQSNTARQGYRTKHAAFFFQDDWKVRPRLTLNLGLRWEFFQPIYEVHDQVVAFRLGQQSTVFPSAPAGLVYPGDKGISRATYPADYTDFGPRFGFAWDVFGNAKLALRGGYGLFYDAPITELTLQFLGVPPYGTRTALTSTFYRAPYELNMSGGRPAPRPNPFPFVPVRPGEYFDYRTVAPIGMTFIDPGFQTPYGQQANLNLQYQMAADWMLDVGYVWSNGVHLLGRRQFNYAIPGPGATTANTHARRILNINNPLNEEYGGAVWGNLRYQATDLNSSYNALQVMVTKRMSYGLTMTHAYTWGHAIDTASGLRGYTRPDNRRANRGNADHDVRHRYVATFLYEFPYMRNQDGVLGKIVGGWGISGITT
ncbi:MAG TPA: TonB-dependent receptor, partial [Bryobacteraceae bacterium]|nr:TonB-dependent receptor [Bryobacteraceae bacterium]